MPAFNGLDLHLGNLSRLSSAQSRSISAENPRGERGGGARAEADPNGPSRHLGRGWKCRPAVSVDPGQTLEMADIKGPGAIQSIWITGSVSRNFILRMFWDGQEQPAVEVPLPDFFAVPWATREGDLNDQFAQVSALPIAVNPGCGLNCFWQMPFRRHCRITLENQHPAQSQRCFYQVNYTLTDVPDDAAYFHAQFRRTNPVPYAEEYPIVDGIRGRGHYVGTSLGWGVLDDRWWGEGEIKFFMDGDQEFPTICGTGTEDYVGGSYDWRVAGEYRTYTTPFLGMHQVVKPDGHMRNKHRHAMYRFHVLDPIRFERDLRVTIQDLGFHPDRDFDGKGKLFMARQDDICSVAYWYQTLPTAPFPPLPDRLFLTLP